MYKRFLVWLAALMALQGVLLNGALAETSASGAAITSIDDLSRPGTTIAAELDTPQEYTLLADFPQAKVVPYNDIFTAYMDVANGRANACVYARYEMELAIKNGITGVRLLDENYDANKVVVGISSVSPIPDLQEKVNAFIAEKRADGTLDDMFARWVVAGDENMPEIAPAENPTVTLRVGTAGSVMPYTYYVGTDLAGYDIELAERFASWLGAKLEFKVYDFGGFAAAAESGAIDVIMSNLYYTEERDEAMLFSDVLFEVPVAVMVKGDGETVPATEVIRWQDYNGRPLGVLVGTLMEDAATEYFPDSEQLLLNSYPDCIAALQAGKVAAYLGDEPSMKILHAEQPEIDYIHERITQNNYSFAFRKNDPQSAALCEELNAFLAERWADGTMQELDDIWFGTDEEKKIVDMSDLTGENGTVRVVTTSTDAPFSYIKDGKNVGYDIDLVVRFCRERGYALELGDVDFAGRIPAIESGKFDFTTDMNVTPERAEQVLFSDPTSYGGIVLAVRSSDLAAGSAEGGTAYASLSELNGRRIGVQTGSTFDEMVAESLPESQVEYYNGKADLVAALTGHKVAAFVVDEPVAQILMREYEGLAVLPEYLDDYEFAFVFPKSEQGEALKDQFNAFFKELPEGTLNALAAKWFGEDEDAKTMPDIAALKAENGTLRLATESGYAPFEYVRDGEIVGYDMELAALFCEACGYGLEIVDMNFDAILPAVQTDKCDFAAAGISITPERAESVLFSEPNYAGGTVLVVLEEDVSAAAGASKNAADTSFWAGIQSSFNKTFIRENRWKLFVEGVLTTLLITVLAILLGTLLGFALFMFCRNGNPAANVITRFCVWLVQGMPMVVLLMILYYVIFGSVAISGVMVAVIGFALTFGASVYGLLKMGVGAVDGGQYEAAYALGYSNRRTFFKIILPQALPHVLPAYKGEIVGLMKATAIVGYIAVQDLTKMGDIVRSRTYEAFFPLIAVTVIYFVLEGLIGFVVSRIGVNLNPKRRKPASILKGVNTRDLH